MTTAIAIVAINLTIVSSTVISLGRGVLEFHFSSIHYFAIGVLEIALLMLLFFLALRRTSKVVGPVKAIARELAKLEHGDLSSEIKLRKGDKFLKEAEVINLAAKALRDRVQRMDALCASIEAEHDEVKVRQLTSTLRAELAGIKTSS